MMSQGSSFAVDSLGMYPAIFWCRKFLKDNSSLWSGKQVMRVPCKFLNVRAIFSAPE